MKLSVLMPVFNELATVEAVVGGVLQVPLHLEVIVVDDASTDGTAAVLDRLERTSGSNVKVFRHDRNRGKGAAVRTALNAATGDVVVIQDADFEYDPNDLALLLTPIENGKADVVYGVRSLDKQKPIMRFGNRFVTMAANVLYRQNLSDIETCYKMMKRAIAVELDLRSHRFDIEAEITAKVIRGGYQILELPIKYFPRYENKKLSPWDGIPTLLALCRYRTWKPESER